MVCYDEDKLFIGTILGMYHIILTDDAVQENWHLFQYCIICEHKIKEGYVTLPVKRFRPASF